MGNRQMGIWCVCLVVVLAASGEVVYRNDFTTRTSTGTIPDAEWHELTYHTGQLYHNYAVGNNFVYSEDVPWSEDEQDGWAKAYMDYSAMVTTGSAGFHALTDGVTDNPCALFRGGTKRTGTAIQSLHNEFTNGILRVEVDIRRPAVWGGTTETYACRVAPIYRQFLNPNWGVGINSASTPIFPARARFSSATARGFAIAREGCLGGLQRGS